MARCQAIFKPQGVELRNTLIGPTGTIRTKFDGASFEIETWRPRWGINVKKLSRERFITLAGFIDSADARPPGEDSKPVALVTMSGLACDHGDDGHRYDLYLNVRHEVRGAKFSEEARAKLSAILGIDLHWPNE